MQTEWTDRRNFIKAGLAAAAAGPALANLRERVRGSVSMPGDPHYDEGRAAWNLTVDQRPAVIVMAAAEEDIVQAVNVACERQLGIAVQATGHGVATPGNGGMLINTAAMRQVKIDATHRTATVAAGAMWGDVLPKAQEAGLAALSGSSSGVGVVGYTSGGGSGWLGRKYGFAADHVLSARVVTANGRVVRASASEHPDLFWAIRGGTSNFGIITELEFRLFPDSHVYGGGIYWPIERASEVADVYREFAASAPETVSSRLALVHLPPIPQIPEALRGRWLVAVQSAFTGPEHEGAAWFAPFRKLGGVVEDALKMMPMAAADAIARDPRDPVPGVVHTELLNEISPDMVRYLVEDVARPRSQVVMMEFRQHGGAYAREPEIANAVGMRPRGFWFNAIAAAMPPGGRAGAEEQLHAVRQGVSKWATGNILPNGIDESGAGRVRSAYRDATWRRLVELKKKYDPTNLFRLNRNIAAA